MNLISKFEKEYDALKKTPRYDASCFKRGYGGANYNTMHVYSANEFKQAIALKIIVDVVACTNVIAKLTPASIRKMFKDDQIIDFMVFIKLNTGVEYLNDNISRYLRVVKYNDRLKKFTDAIGGELFKGPIKKGMRILADHQPKKYTAILDATEELEVWSNSTIKWNKICFDVVETYGRNGAYGIGTNVRLIGRTSTGKNIEYGYSQPQNSESANRLFNYDNGLTKPISQIRHYPK